jgi:hypothetical protein
LPFRVLIGQVSPTLDTRVGLVNPIHRPALIFIGSKHGLNRHMGHTFVILMMNLVRGELARFISTYLDYHRGVAALHFVLEPVHSILTEIQVTENCAAVFSFDDCQAKSLP